MGLIRTDYAQTPDLLVSVFTEARGYAKIPLFSITAASSSNIDWYKVFGTINTLDVVSTVDAPNTLGADTSDTASVFPIPDSSGTVSSASVISTTEVFSVVSAVGFNAESSDYLIGLQISLFYTIYLPEDGSPSKPSHTGTAPLFPEKF
ncbi:hypothetical protein KIL84_003595 [Mauremys mutica]|uniref:Uncharacterized protein n=1 Tax=Mauremys mutica TaxID=74926 RepID=A0A9D3WU23_9SAUR|nr:hypothetical protein KIL84_003595 [Mauremys mutica]